MVVVALMGLLLALVPARLGATSGAELRAASRSVAAGLRHARAIAIGQRVETVFQLDLEHKKFTVTGDQKEHHLPRGIDLKLFTGQQEVTTEKLGGIRFYPDGGATGGRVTLAAGERKFEVDVDWMTGRVSIGD
jgi:general secretion pathway protein H